MYRKLMEKKYRFCHSCMHLVVCRSISSDEDLINFSFEKLSALWDEIESHSSKRRTWIDDAHRMFNEVEDERLETVRSLFLF